MNTYYHTNKALKSGELTKAPCRVCGSDNVHAHHRNYNDPLDIDWLCPTHHRREHVRLKKQGQEIPKVPIEEQGSEVVHLRLPMDTYKAAQAVAIKDGRTLANLLRLVIERYFDKKP